MEKLDTGIIIEVVALEAMFFFSSRRRHTRSKRDWSSDVCSSDLIQNESPGKDKESNWLPAPKGPFVMAMRLYWPKEEATERSEERRVGKECGYGMWPYH